MMNAKLGRLCPAADWAWAVTSGGRWLAPKCNEQIVIRPSVDVEVAPYGVEMVRYVLSFAHLHVVIKVHDRAQHTSNASHRIASIEPGYQVAQVARSAVVPQIIEQERSKKYLPTKPKASLIALAAVGITLGPGAQLGEPQPNLMGPFPSKVGKVHKDSRFKVTRCGLARLDGDQRAGGGRYLPSTFPSHSHPTTSAVAPSASLPGSGSRLTEALAEPTSKHGRRCTGRALVSSADRGLPWPRDKFRALIDRF